MAIAIVSTLIGIDQCTAYPTTPMITDRSPITTVIVKEGRAKRHRLNTAIRDSPTANATTVARSTCNMTIFL